jgi:hypothetical protein
MNIESVNYALSAWTAKFSKLEMHEKIMSVFTWGLLIWFVLLIFRLYQPADLLFPIAITGLAIGYALSLWKNFGRMLAHIAAKFLLAAANILCLYLATVFARGIVADAIGLPPQDFDLTVTAAMLISVPLVMIATTSIVLAALALKEYLWAILKAFKKSTLSESFRDSTNHLARFAGAFGLLYFFSMLGSIGSYSSPYALELLRYVAYIADYQQAPLYPTINKTERIRLHENGVISTAKIVDGRVQISVRRLEN